ncbi:dihydrolipoyl dehydrogenase [Ancylobacter amanitiformis]|uniref:Dihydrolipoyl dehydrogenase n=1 Tax=Ancylobacter amanitiformis TaxID=217069 RepID=A0ABU0LKI3_9HYPH|nr:dihydrolipoyl dehydrogenase [Ancylobacter amanitiformis]MDQ0509206.1 dihydrolipoamide dehydrogenase [Ancylobacter amanitiformis]
MANNYDVLFIGSGPGGYVGAIRAAQLGLKVGVIERQYVGGICPNWGCIPAKALLRSAEIFHYIEHAKDYGLVAEKTGVDIAGVVKRSRGIAAQMSNGVGFLLKKNKVDVIWGQATLTAPGKVSVASSAEPAPKGALAAGDYTAKNIVIATGARPRALPGIEPDKKLIWTYFEALAPASVPKSLLIMGSGAIGVEFASFYKAMGSDVTIVELLPQILPVEDEEIAAHARKRFEKQGIKILTGAKVSKVVKGADNVTATVETADGKVQTLTADRLISAVGVVGNIENLGLEALGVKTDRGCVVIDGLCRTNVPGLWAIGDVAGPPMLAHKAEHEGVIAAEAIAGGHAHPMDKLMVPGCTYCMPQVASVGLTEKRAKEAGYEIKVGRFPFIGNGKAVALGESEGLVKTIFDAKTGQLLGAHLVGAEVTEMIQGFVLAMNLETTEEELINAVFPHPTVSETMHESVLAAYGRAIHM